MDQIFYCEPCDKEFKNIKGYNAHIQTHEGCKHPGCQFSASKKVVIAHYHAKHGLFSGSGYKDIEVEGRKFRVLLGSDEKEIEQWRAERRKQFPTLANIARKDNFRDKVSKAGGVVPKLGKGVKKLEGDQGQCEDVKSDTQVENKNDYGNEQQDKGTNGEEANDGEVSTLSRPSKSDGIRRRPCKYYAQGRCKNGDDCSHSHDFEVKVCKFYVQYGRCNRTRNGGCSFFHDRNAYEEHKRNNAVKGPSGGTTGKQQVVFGSISGLKKVVGAKEPSLMSKLLQDQIHSEENIVLQSFRFLVQHYHLALDSNIDDDNGGKLDKERKQNKDYSSTISTDTEKGGDELPE